MSRRAAAIHANSKVACEIAPAIYADLDGTLIKTDILVEGALRLFRHKPLSLFAMFFWLLKGGKARLKAEIASRIDIPPPSLPYHAGFLAWLRQQHEDGRALILASASDIRYVRQIAEHLGIFSAVLASDGVRNLAGAEKLRAIKEHAAGAPFDYAGNAYPDLEIWPEARGAVIVDPDPALLKKARERATVLHVFDDRRRGILKYLRAMRVYQWTKNLLLLVPMFTAHKLLDSDAWQGVLWAFVAFSFVASSTYLLNDLLDLASDRQHPRKRTRPLAAGDVPLTHGVMLSALLLIAGLVLAAAQSLVFLATVLLYLAVTLAYSLHFKTFMLIDVVCLASLYTLRIIAGALAIDVQASNWLLAFSMFLFLSLALVKRCAELQSLAGLERRAATGRDYRVADYPVFLAMGIASGYVAVLVFALFIDSPHISSQYANPRALWLACPLFLYWISRLWVKTMRGEMHDDPLIYSLKDRASWGMFIGIVISVLAAQWSL